MYQVKKAYLPLQKAHCAIWYFGDNFSSFFDRRSPLSLLSPASSNEKYIFKKKSLPPSLPQVHHRLGPPKGQAQRRRPRRQFRHVGPGARGGRRPHHAGPRSLPDDAAVSRVWPRGAVGAQGPDALVGRGRHEAKLPSRGLLRRGAVRLRWVRRVPRCGFRGWEVISFFP